MKRHLGLISLLGSCTSWAVLVMMLLWGGLDPSSSQARLAQLANGSAFIIAFLSSITALIPVVKGPERLLGALAFTIGVLFILVFTGSVFVLIA